MKDIWGLIFDDLLPSDKLLSPLKRKGNIAYELNCITKELSQQGNMIVYSDVI